MSVELRRTSLHDRHRAAGARMVPFAGYEMPVAYGSIVEEHRHVRSAAGMFDVSHMGEIWLRGANALALAQRLFTNDARGLADGQVRYGMLCRDDGGVIDDVTLYRLSQVELFFCVNASRREEDLAWIREVRAREAPSVVVEDRSDETGLISVQGPRAPELVERVARPERPPRRFRFAPGELAGSPVLLSRTGYTGEDGYEIYVSTAAAGRAWDALLGASEGVLRPIGLGARDTLRTEMGYALYGHELSLERSPLAAGLARFVELQASFIGAEALERERQRGPRERLVGLVLEGRSVARAGFAIACEAGPGVVTSGTFSPSVERSIAMGYVPPVAAAPGTMVAIDVRGRPEAARVTPLPFYRPGSAGGGEVAS